MVIESSPAETLPSQSSTAALPVNVPDQLLWPLWWATMSSA